MMDHPQSLTRFTRSDISAAFPPVPTVRCAVNQQQLSFTDLVRTIARRKISVFGFAAATFCAVAAYAYLKTPSYEGVARLQIDPTRSSNLGLDDSDKSTSSSTDTDSRVATEVTILHSNTVARQVMESQKLYAQPQFAGKDAAGPDIRDFSQLTPSQRQKMFTKFDDDLTVRVIPNTQVVEIRFRSPNPSLASDTANSVIDEYTQRNFHARVDGTAQISQWLSTQMEEIRAHTTISQQKLAAFQKANNLLGTDESDNIVTDRLKQLNEELTQAEADRIIKEGRYRLTRSGDPELIATVVPSATIQVLRTQQADLQDQYSQLSSKFGPGYPKLRELQARLDDLTLAIQTEGGNIGTRLANEYSAAAKAEGMIRDNFEKQKTDAYKLNEHAAQYAILRHEVESGQQLYDTLQLKLKEAGIASGLNSSYISVIDRAELPDKPVEPRKGLDLVLGLGAGLLGGVMVGFAVDSFDDTVGTSREVELAALIPELVSVPFLAGLSIKNAKVAKHTGSIFSSDATMTPIALREARSPAVESYRALSNVILLSSLRDSTKMLVVTSARPGEGKSTVSCNLATALAQRGRKVLMVDADLRSASSTSNLGTAGPSLATMFEVGAGDHPRYRPIASLPTLNVLRAGIRPVDSPELLDSARMQDLMAAWRTEYDHIIIDTPPVLLFADALVLAARADAAILVTRSGMSRKHEMLRARDLLARSGANILGFVLNAVRCPDYSCVYCSPYRTEYPQTEKERRTQTRLS